MKKGFISAAKKARIALAILTAIGCSFVGTGHVLADDYVAAGTMSGTGALAVGATSTAGADNALATGESAKATGASSSAYGTSASARSLDSIAIGASASAGADGSSSTTVRTGQIYTAEQISEKKLQSGVDYEYCFEVTLEDGKYVYYKLDENGQKITDSNGAYETYTEDELNELKYKAGVDYEVGDDGKYYAIQTVTEGEKAIAMGSNAAASGAYSLAIGNSSVASNNYSMAIGSGASSTGINGLALGNYTSTTGTASVALGSYSKATDDYVVSVGSGDANDSDTFQYRKVVNVATATADHDAAIYEQVITKINTSTQDDKTYMNFYVGEEGTKTDGTAEWSIELPTGSSGSGIPVGTTDGTTKDKSLAIGTSSYADGGSKKSALAVGTGSWAEGNGSMAIGDSSYSVYGSTAVGYGTKADQGYTTALGTNTEATNEGATAIGAYTEASGYYSTALGEEAVASGSGSVALGAYSQATDKYVVSVGSGKESDADTYQYRKIVNMANGTTNHDAATYGQLLKADTYTLSADNSYSITLKTNDGTNGPTIKLDTASLGGSGSGSGSLTQAQFNEFLANSTDYTNLKNTVDSKADTTTVNSALANKADTTTVNTALADKAEKDGSNIDNSKGKWSSALGTGEVKSGDNNLVTGDTVHTAIQTVKDDVTQNTTDIATNKANIATNKANIETNKNNIEANKSAIGTLTELKTTNQSSLVEAINEVKASSDKNLETAKTYTDTAKADAISTAEKYSDEKLKEANTYTDTEVSKVKEAVGSNSADIAGNKAAIAANTSAIRSLGKKVNKVGAGAAALAALHPLDFDPEEKLTFAAGYGNYEGENAVALGAFYRPNENVMFSVAGNMGNGENMVNAGVSFALGSGSTTTTSRAVMAKKLAAQNEQIAVLNNTVAAQDAKLSQQDERLAEQDAKLSAQDKEIAELKAMVAALAGQR